MPAKYVARAVFDPTNKNTAYVSFDAYGVTSGQHVWKTTNFNGSPPTWSPAGIGIPDVPVNALAVDPANSSNVYAGTDIGVYASSNGGTSWTAFGTGLPAVAVFDMAIQNPHHILRIATHGRGMWQMSLSGGAAPVFVSAVSRKVHGGAGTFDLPLSAVATNPTTEPRQGPAQTIVFTFDKAISAATATITEGTATATTPTFSGNNVIVALTGVNNQQYVTLALTAVAGTDGSTGGTGSVRVGFLAGDVNQNRVVTLADLGLVNAQLAQSVTASNFLKDVNASGTLTLADKGITNANLTKALPAP